MRNNFPHSVSHYSKFLCVKIELHDYHSNSRNYSEYYSFILMITIT